MSDTTLPTPQGASWNEPGEKTGDLIGRRLGHYRVTERLGKGGMGELYVAYDETLDRKVALKSIRGRYTEDPEAKARFLQEARTLSRLEHPNICQIYDYLETAFGDFLVLELIRGPTLREVIDGPAPRRERLRVAGEILSALVAAHQEGVVHRDLKPSNVMLTESGRVKVLDFGLARRLSDDRATLTLPSREAELPGTAPEGAPSFLDVRVEHSLGETATGSVLGTPGYMSPEQARGEVASPASDMYTFGLVLRELLAGRRLYPPEIDSLELYQRALRAEAPEVGGLPRALDRLTKALASPDHRQRPSAEGARACLEAFLARPRRIAILCAVLLAVLASLKYGYDVTRARDEAQEARRASEVARSQAEALATFMLEDLLERLEPIGRTDLLEEVTAETLRYFENLPRELHDRSPQRLAATLIAVGDVRKSRGDLTGALGAFERARACTAPFVEAEGATGELLDLHARALGRIGYALHGQGELEAAEASQRSALAIRLRLHDKDPKRSSWAAALAQTRRRIGDLLFDRDELDGAREQYERALSIRRELSDRDPESPERAASLSLILGSVGEVLQAQGNLDGALGYFEEALAIDRGLHESDPGQTSWAWNLSHSLHFVGSILEARGDLAGARGLYEETVTIDRGLHALDPDNADWASSLALSLGSVGGVLARQGETSRARETFEESAALDRRLHERHPDNADWATSLAYTTYRLARLDRAAGRTAAAHSKYAEVARLLRPRAAADELGLEARELLVESLLELGRVEEARPHARRLAEADRPRAGENERLRELARRYGLLENAG